MNTRYFLICTFVLAVLSVRADATVSTNGVVAFKDAAKIKIMQGEVGCPAQLEFAHALKGIEWSEYSQAKWDSPIMIAERASIERRPESEK